MANLLREHQGPIWVDTAPAALLALMSPGSEPAALVRTTIPVDDARRERAVFEFVRETLPGGGLEEGIQYYAKVEDAVTDHPALNAIALQRAREGRPLQGVLAIAGGAQWFGVFSKSGSLYLFA